MMICRKRGTKKVVTLTVLVCTALMFYKLVSDLEPLAKDMRQHKTGGFHWIPKNHKRSDMRRDDRSDKYCNYPNKPVNGLEGVIPEGYRLRTLHVFIRHGDRTSIKSMASIQQPTFECNRTNWYMDVWGERLKRYADYMDDQAQGNMPILFQLYPLYPNTYKCPDKSLTNIGVLQHLLLGEYLSRQYIEKNNLFDGSVSKHLQISVRSTGTRRTFHSALALMHGFIPGLKVAELNLTGCRDLYMCLPSLHASCKCDLTTLLDKRIRSIENSVMKNVSKHENVIDKVANTLQIDRGSIRSNSYVLDTILPSYCHNNTYACFGVEHPRSCLDKYRSLLWDAYIDMKKTCMQDPGQTYLKYYFLKLYPVLTELYKSIETFSETESYTKFRLYSGHDKTLTALLIVLGLYDGTWPPYASRLVFEVIVPIDQSEDNNVYLRFVYNGNDVTRDVIFCKHRTQQSLCNVDYFKEYVSNTLLDLLGHSEFVDACKSTL